MISIMYPIKKEKKKDIYKMYIKKYIYNVLCSY